MIYYFLFLQNPALRESGPVITNVLFISIFVTDTNNVQTRQMKGNFLDKDFVATNNYALDSRE